LHFPLRPKKTPPGTELCNPANFEDKLALFIRVPVFVLHDAVLNLPVQVNGGWKCRNDSISSVGNDCRHQFNLSDVETCAVIRPCNPRFDILAAILLPFQKPRDFPAGRKVLTDD
jgi:hypothetical protein